MGAATNQRLYDWDTAKIGDAAPPSTLQITEEGIADYCRAARYENPVYNSLAAAKDAGYAVSVLPPAMLLALAPLRLDQVARAAGCVLPAAPIASSTGKLAIQFGGSTLGPGDVITSTTSVQNKFQDENDRFITFRVVAHNQRDEAVIDYCQTLPWPAADS